jgi:hypothetical protein
MRRTRGGAINKRADHPRTALEPERVAGAAKERLKRSLRGRAEPEAACVTLVAGSTVGQVLDAFDADPGAPAVDRSEVPFGIPAVAVAETPGGVVAIEDNGFQGAAHAVLRLASARGRAASMYSRSPASTSSPPNPTRPPPGRP